MHLVDAVIAIAQSDVPEKWARYCEIAPRILPDADAPRELLLQARLTRGSYDGTQRGWSGGREVQEAFALEEIFLERFAAAAQAGRYCMRGFRCGEFAATAIDPTRVTVEALKGLAGERWELNGVTLYRVSVDAVTEPAPPPPSPPEREDADESQVHDEIDAVYKHCKATDQEPPNLKEIGKLVQERLRAKGLYASQGDIRRLAGDKRYLGIRHKPGPRQQRRKPAGTAPEQR
jgi:hypothetical protein